jgi:hypothetical protein
MVYKAILKPSGLPLAIKVSIPSALSTSDVNALNIHANMQHLNLKSLWISVVNMYLKTLLRFKNKQHLFHNCMCFYLF